MGSESVTSLLLEAGSLMLIGMVFVFSFLALLIVGIHLIAKFCEAFPGEAAPQYAAPRRKAVQAGREAYLAGLGGKSFHAEATSPLTGFLN